MELQIIRSRITNDREYPLTLIIEPWADEYPMPPGLSYDIVFQGPSGGTVEFASRDQQLIVWGWSGSTYLLYQGHTLVRECNLPVPPIPSVNH